MALTSGGWRLPSGWQGIVAVSLSLALLVVMARPALAGFQGEQQFGTGINPVSVASADLNGDGKPDLAVTNYGNSVATNTVSVLRNTTATGATTPTFAAQQAFTSGTNPVSVVAADLNGDGRPDLAIANNLGNNVTVLLNTTTPGATTFTFATLQTFTAGSNPQAVTAADLNGDGKPDLIVTNQGSGNVGVLRNTMATGATTASFAAQQSFSPGTNPRVTAAGDLNGDGRPDLAVANEGGFNVGVLLNITTPGATTFAFAALKTFAAGSNPQAVMAADLNGDGKPDLAVARGSDATNVSVLLNTTATGATIPTFADQQTFPTGAYPRWVAVADLNGDGRPDLAVSNQGNNNVGVLLNTTASGATTPTFAAQQTSATGTGPRSVAAADLNGDGKPDLAVANSISNNVSVLLASPSGSIQFSSPGGTVAEAAGTATVTLTRSGSTDGQVSALISASGGSATPGSDYSLAGPQTVTWADGDGAAKTPSIPIIQDQVNESDETLQLSLALPANPFGATLAAQTTSTVTIADDDPPLFTIGSVSVAEGSSGTTTALFTVTRVGATTRTATVQYATADGSAHAGSDYTATSGILTFAPDETSKTIAVPILGDTTPETDETFSVSLSNATNADPSVYHAGGIIQNDDGPVACSPRPRVTQTKVAGGGALSVHVESTPLNTSAANPLQQIRVGTLLNATVSVNGEPVASGQTIQAPPDATGVDLVIRRATPGQAATVPFTVVDACGEWQTFVGGGVAGGF